MLNSFVNDGTMLFSVPFSILAETPSGPLPLDVSNELIRVAGSDCRLSGGTAILKQIEKKLFSIVALAESVEANVSLSEGVGMADFCLLRHLIDFQNNFLLEGFKFLR